MSILQNTNIKFSSVPFCVLEMRVSLETFPSFEDRQWSLEQRIFIYSAAAVCLTMAADARPCILIQVFNMEIR